MDIQIVSKNKKDYLPLLLLGDEQESMIDRYLDRGELFVMHGQDRCPAAVAVVTREEAGLHELKNLAVATDLQRKGLGRSMVDYLCQHYRPVCHTLLVGTGETPSTLAFYRSCGFTYSHTVRDFFTRHYDHPIWEDGRLLTDMIYLRKALSPVIALPREHRTDDLTAALHGVWEAAVRATHHFLTEEDIRRLAPYAESALRSVGGLLVAYVQGKPVAFLGFQEQKIEMLFVRPDHSGQGWGSRLVRTAIDTHRATLVDVNEQNPAALAFYRRMGFEVFRRDEQDDQGNPFPILRMKLREEAHG